MNPVSPTPRVLIVDDETVIGEMLQDILETYGFPSAFAETREKAIELMPVFKPTVALIDYHLVTTTGFEVSKSLKQLDVDIPVILMTAYPSLELAVKAIQNDIYDFLAKPVDKAYLFSTITKAMEKRILTEENKKLIVSLQESNQVLDRLNRMKSKFLSIVTHDLRTPLVSVQGYSELLRTEENLTEQDKEKCFQSIRISVDRMKGLINNLMDMVSIESGKLRIEKTSLDYIQVCTEVQMSLSPVAQSRKIDLLWEIPSQPVPVMGDSHRLVQVLTNLITNAFKHTQSKGKITVKVFRQDKTVRTEVVDTGEGIPKEDQPRLFEQYYQVESSETKREGLGLGLSIAKEIVEAHGGQIGVQSKGPNQGSLFFFTLPL
ncbi:MAG: response regulator [Elusimicrobia bacterium]|nr:response regulator [Elusimicrobiota bacterium]